MTETAHELSWV